MPFGPFVYNGAPFSPYVYITRNRITCDPNASEVVFESSTVLRNQTFHYQPGVAYGKRGIHLDAHFLPSAQTFTVEGLACFPNSISERLVLLAYLNSLPVSGLLQLFCGQHKHVGYLNCLPFSQTWKLSQSSECKLLKFMELKRSLLLIDETSPIFGTLFSDNQKANTIAFEWNSLEHFLNDVSEAFTTVHDEVGREVAEWLGFPADWEGNSAFRDIVTSIPPPDPTDIFDENDFQNKPAHCARIIGVLIGYSIGRWDIRYTTGERQPPELPDPFAPLPACPPGMLQNAAGLPAGPGDVPAEYPVKDIPWDGILVDDPEHPLDIERRIRGVIEIIWTGQNGAPNAAAIESEACELLEVRSLREYFRKPAGFFADHLKRYSKSRRKAPIYWPLSTPSGGYTIWLYYHRLNDGTLYKVVEQFVEPKQAEVQATFQTLAAKESRSRAEDRELENAQTLLGELASFRDDLLRLAKIWKPNLNDGVVITAAPLWRHFRLPAWQKELRTTWESLERGEYDWAHLAHSLWPERVTEKCKTDRSLAIAHGLEHLCTIEPPKPKKKRTKAKVEEDAQEGELL
jgi:hypothetical protein